MELFPFLKKKTGKLVSKQLRTTIWLIHLFMHAGVCGETGGPFGHNKLPYINKNVWMGD
jgi:hypothetical protein